MLPSKVGCPMRQFFLSSSGVRVAAVYTVLLLLSTRVTCGRTTMLRHDLHTFHHVDSRSPEIDPFWYVGRGVRPIGRFGKRQSGSGLLTAVNNLELLLRSLRSQGLQSLEKEESDWLP